MNQRCIPVLLLEAIGLAAALAALPLVLGACSSASAMGQSPPRIDAKRPALELYPTQPRWVSNPPAPVRLDRLYAPMTSVGTGYGTTCADASRKARLDLEIKQPYTYVPLFAEHCEPSADACPGRKGPCKRAFALGAPSSDVRARRPDDILAPEMDAYRCWVTRIVSTGVASRACQAERAGDCGILACRDAERTAKDQLVRFVSGEIAVHLPDRDTRFEAASHGEQVTRFLSSAAALDHPRTVGRPTPVCTTERCDCEFSVEMSKCLSPEAVQGLGS